MKVLKNLFFALAIFAVMVFTCSWGFLVHKTAHQLAIYELPSNLQQFFYKNMDYMIYNSVRPDVRRSKDPSEASKHFIDAEVYGDAAVYKMPLKWEDAVAKYSKDTLLKYGYVPYHVIYMKNKLTEAFKSGNKDSILFYAADLGHYIEDANVPLHTSVNYDGQLTNQKGLHALWESVVPEIEIDNYTLSSKHKATYLKNPTLAIWTAVRGANALLTDVFGKEKEVSAGFTDATKYRVQNRNGRQVKYYTTAFAKTYAAALKNTINDQLIKSANLVADFWYTAWVDAGKPDVGKVSVLTKEEDQQLKKEINSFNQNHLIVDKYLQAQKDDKKGDE
jgi:hypothetical protein